MRVVALRATALIASGVLTMCTLTGCGNKTPEGIPEAAARRNPLVQFLVDSSKHIDTKSWRVGTYPQMSYCEVHDSGPTTQWYYMLLSPAGQRPKEDVQKIAEYWRSRGLHMDIEESGEFPTVYATGGPVRSASFETDGPRGEYKLGATSVCGKGDALEILEREKAQRNSGEKLYGDDLPAAPAS